MAVEHTLFLTGVAPVPPTYVWGIEMRKNKLQNIGGIAALVGSFTVVVGLGMFATLLTDYTTGEPTPAESVAFVADNYATLYVWNTITLVVFAIALVFVAVALRERLKERTPGLSTIAAAFGVIWSALLFAGGMVTNIGFGSVSDLATSNPDQAESVWLTLDAVQSGLSGGNEIVGGMWILLVSWAGLRNQNLPKGLNYLGLVMAVAALVTIVPALEMVAVVFGLGLIVWFAWLGVVMMRSREDLLTVDIRTSPRELEATSR